MGAKVMAWARRTGPIFRSEPNDSATTPMLFCATEIFTGACIDSNHFADADERRHRYFKAGLQNSRLELGGRGRPFHRRLRLDDFQFDRRRQFETQWLLVIHDDV